MSTRMLIDARHSEETRVTVVKGSRVEDFDYESSVRRQLKGNIYLARVTRVEPSLQAAFVEYGGNRHGFLAFSEIHPDYYQIPVEDRDAIIAEETQAAAAEKDAEDAAEEAQEKPKRRPRRRRGRKSSAENATDTDAVVTADADAEDQGAAKTVDTETEEKPADAEDKAAADSEDKSANADQNEDAEANDDGTSADVKEAEEEEKDAEIEAATRRRNLRALKRRYSIQEVIKRRQVLLIQVVKEERGNKGAALTTYMSLAGRYCVLMPNSTHSGGISRKISNLSDRKKLKQITNSLVVPEEMGLIVRTAGINRTKTEIKRDYDYLLRLWNGIRDLTLKSTAPALIYEEGNLIKRTIRDVYTRDIDEIWVEGERGYRAAKDFMKLLMPSHAKKVQSYKDRIPLFHRYQVESQLEAMYQPVVQLKSGGYIVINPTEALISIDVNSGRSTKESNIEETAVKTNLEAAEEVARQLRLRDMAGLVVIDFIDMEDNRNNRAVERRMKDALKTDRARIQVGRISSFGLMEMSRQRMRPNLLEVAMETCSHCSGIGLVRSVESAALMALRELEEEGIRSRSSIVRVSASPDVAIYLLNNKRSMLSDLENQYKFRIEVLAQSNLGPSDIEITRETGVEAKPAPSEGVVVKMDSAVQEEETEPKEPASEDKDDQPRKKRRRRRRRRRGQQDENPEAQGQEAAPAEAEEPSDKTEGEKAEGDEAEKPSRRRRGSRGGRRRRGRGENDAQKDENTDIAGEEPTAETKSDDAAASENDNDKANASDEGEKPKRRRRRVKKSDEQAAGADDAPETGNEEDSDQSEDKPKRAPRRRRKAVNSDDNSETAAPVEEKAAGDEEKPKPRRRRRTSAEKAADDAAATEEKPKRRGRPRKKPVTESSEATADTPAKEPAKEKAPRKPAAKKSVKAEAPAKATPAKPEASKPVEGGGSDPALPKKKGWWQRTFG
jgi:ribonuclease E